MELYVEKHVAYIKSLDTVRIQQSMKPTSFLSTLEQFLDYEAETNMSG